MTDELVPLMPEGPSEVERLAAENQRLKANNKQLTNLVAVLVQQRDRLHNELADALATIATNSQN